jgi:hypothetical protein
MKTRLPTGVQVILIPQLKMTEVVGGEVTVVEVALTEVALEVEVLGVEENPGALVAEVDQTGKVLVVDGDQTEDLEEAEAVEGMTDLVVGTTVVILVRMDPLTGRRGQIMLKDGRIIMGLGLGLHQVVELVVVGTVVGQNR